MGRMNTLRKCSGILFNLWFTYVFTFAGLVNFRLIRVISQFEHIWRRRCPKQPRHLSNIPSAKMGSGSMAFLWKSFSANMEPWGLLGTEEHNVVRSDTFENCFVWEMVLHEYRDKTWKRVQWRIGRWDKQEELETRFSYFNGIRRSPSRGATRLRRCDGYLSLEVNVLR